MKNKLYSILVCCLVLGFGSVGRAEDNTAHQEQAALSCSDGCSNTHDQCSADDKVPEARCIEQEASCYDNCEGSALKQARAEKKERLRVCLKAARDKRWLATKACRTAFNNTPATVGTCTADRIKARGVRNQCKKTASETYRNDIKACYK